MTQAFDKALYTSSNGIGGPFGACIVKDGEVIAVASNTVLHDNDPTAHAEINAIRQACKKLGTYDLKGCVLYTTAYPCPMCLSAIIWANIDTVYYGCTAKDAEEIGFRDKMIYEYLNGELPDLVSITELNRQECLHLFNSYKQNGKIY